MKKIIYKIKRLLRPVAVMAFSSFVFVSCQKNNDMAAGNMENSNETQAVSAARALENSAPANVAREGAALGISETDRNGNRSISEIAIANPNFSSLVAAVVKTGLAGALSDPAASLTVFAPTNAAFAQLPAPFNNSANISGISDAGQVDFLRNVLLYHVLGAEVYSNQVANGRSSATTLKPAGSANDNTIYLSKTFSVIRINGQSTVIYPNINANNGVIHAINKVLLFPTQNIAEIAIGNPAFSSLVAALVKTNLAGVFTGAGDFTVFAPTDAAFAKLPAPFNNAANISNISSQAEIDALANILTYHVTGSRYFNWDLGILSRITTLASAPNNKLTTVLGFNTGWVKGDKNARFSQVDPGDILATNGVIHVIGDVLLPR
jgi:uncharacterized surface protein with fasciclin (FAS1) repeats